MKALMVMPDLLAKEQDGKVYLLEIYDKSDASSVKLNVIKDWIESL